MLLVLDMGNTNITMGIYDGATLRLQSRIATDPTKMEDQYAVELMDLLRLYRLEPRSFSGADETGKRLGSVIRVFKIHGGKTKTGITGCFKKFRGS